jgi:hypothetical protein
VSDFVEITRSDAWFKQHPEKIAGVEYETTSFYFPIQVKGTKEDVLRVTGHEVVKPNNKKINDAKAKALTKIKMLKLKLALEA